MNRRPLSGGTKLLIWCRVGLPLSVLLTQWLLVFLLWAPQGMERLTALRDAEFAYVMGVATQHPIAAFLPEWLAK